VDAPAMTMHRDTAFGRQAPGKDRGNAPSFIRISPGSRVLYLFAA
jgi:hypothetical protein